MGYGALDYVVRGGGVDSSRGEKGTLGSVAQEGVNRDRRSMTETGGRGSWGTMRQAVRQNPQGRF